MVGERPVPVATRDAVVKICIGSGTASVPSSTAVIFSRIAVLGQVVFFRLYDLSRFIVQL
jgi:hypothetical protein